MVKQVCKLVLQLLLLIIIYQIGTMISKFFHLQIPGNVIGIVMLLLLLWTGFLKVEQIDLASDLLLKHLGFFFIPISVGLMTLGNLLGLKVGVYLLIILVISAIVGLVAAGKTTQTIILNSEKEQKDHDYTL